MHPAEKLHRNIKFAPDANHRPQASFSGPESVLSECRMSDVDTGRGISSTQGAVARRVPGALLVDSALDDAIIDAGVTATYDLPSGICGRLVNRKRIIAK